MRQTKGERKRKRAETIILEEATERQTDREREREREKQL